MASCKNNYFLKRCQSKNIERMNSFLYERKTYPYYYSEAIVRPTTRPVNKHPPRNVPSSER